jgi:hypothetical protein
VVGDEAAFVLGQQQAVAKLGRRSRLALADRAGVRVRKQHQAVSDHPVTGQALIGLGQLADQSTKPPVTAPACQRPAGVAGDHLDLTKRLPGEPALPASMS